MPGTAPSGWQTPKTNWQSADVVQPADMNRMEGNTSAIETGSRTIDPAQTPSGVSGTLRQFLDWFANRIKAITGKTNWYDTPDTTLAAAKSHIDAAAPHSGHETPSGAQAKVDTHAAAKQTHGASGSYYLAKTSRSDQLPAWGDIAGKPSTFTPSAHKSTHESGGTDAVTALASGVTIGGNTAWHAGNDGTGSGLDADLLDGQHGSYYQNASNLNAGTIPLARIPTTLTGKSADMVDGYHAKETGADAHVVATDDSGNLDVSGTLFAFTDIVLYGNFRPQRDSVNYTGRVYVPLQQALIHTSWDGDAKAVGTYTITPLMFNYPSAARAVSIMIQAKWATASDSSVMYAQNPGSGAAVLVRAQVANIYDANSGIVTCDTSGQFTIVVAGANASAVTLEIHGFFL